MADHPYKHAENRAFWARSVARSGEIDDVIRLTSPLIATGERVMSAGSCFAVNMIPFLESNGFGYVRTEFQSQIWGEIPEENLSYAKFSAGYGNIYTARQLLQLLLRCQGKWRPIEDRIHVDGKVVDLFRPGLRWPAQSNAEFETITARHLRCVREAIAEADVFIFTLGLTEAWISRDDGAVYPACPGTIAGEFDPHKHAFINFSAREVSEDLDRAISELRSINPRIRLILTVSPVPLVATATDQHVIVATSYSKAALRVAAEEVSQKYKFASYFPAFEIVAGIQAPDTYLEEDRRNPTKLAIDAVMRLFLAACGKGRLQIRSHQVDPSPTLAEPQGSEVRGRRSALADLASQAIRAECEEAMADAS